MWATIGMRVVLAFDEQAQGHDHLVLQVPTLPVSKRRPPPPTGRSDLGWIGEDPGLLMELSDRCVEVGLTRVDAAARQFPPAAEIRVIGVVGVKEQHLVLDV